MTSRPTKRALASLTIAAALLLGGCAGSGGSGTTGDTGGETGGDRIRVAFMQPPKAAMNPFSDDAFKLSRLSAAETLVRLDENIQPQPLLATGWERVDDLTWVFTLRDDVVFHDGTPFDAAAVKNTLDRAGESGLSPRALSGIHLTVEVTAGDEVTVVTDVADAMLPNRLASPQLSILSAAAYGDDGTVTPLGTGTGPFEITAIEGSTTMTLERFDDYWGDKAIASGIDASFVPDGTARAAALRSSEADVAETIPVSQISLLDPDMVHEVFMPRTTHLALNTASGPFSDPAVRAAARAAIDATQIADTVYEGHADPAVGILGPAVPWAADKRGDTTSPVQPADVHGVEITLATYTDRAENPEIAVQIEAQLEAAGFVVTQDVREYAHLEQDMLGGAFDAVIVSRNTMLDTGDPLSAIMQDFSCDGGNNIAQLCDPEIDRILKDGLQYEPGAEREDATMAAETAILRLNATIPLVHERVVQGELGTFTGFARDPLERTLITQYTEPTG
ncbi:ABC transporter substrate-binding protein [Microbacterium sp.]|uniref:ABC transporter substrate-binding protein n=1 Tax=Microbacterium sp. TaxID=51671 RepID=UPI0039E60ACF